MLHLLIVSVVWAFSFGLIGRHLADVDASFVAAVRIGLSLLIFLPFLKLSRLRGLGLTAVLRIAAVGAVQFGLMYVAFIGAFGYLPSHQIALLTVTTPLFVAITHDLEARRLHLGFFGAATLAVTGAAVVLWRTPSFSDALTGVLLVQVSNLCFAFGQLRYRRIKRAHPRLRDRELHALLFLGAMVTTAGAALLSGSFVEYQLRGDQLLVLGYLGVVASGLCFFMWNTGATRVNAGTLAAFNNLKIPMAVVVSLLFFEAAVFETVIRAAIGVALVIVAIVLAERTSRRRLPRTL